MPRSTRKNSANPQIWPAYAYLGSGLLTDCFLKKHRTRQLLCITGAGAVRYLCGVSQLGLRSPFDSWWACMGTGGIITGGTSITRHRRGCGALYQHTSFDTRREKLDQPRCVKKLQH